MKKLILIVVGICLVSCSTETITNTTTTINNYYYGTKLDSIDTLYVAEPWIENDSTEVVEP